MEDQEKQGNGAKTIKAAGAKLGAIFGSIGQAVGSIETKISQAADSVMETESVKKVAEGVKSLGDKIETATQAGVEKVKEVLKGEEDEK